MALINLIFQSTPITAPPVNLVFGEIAEVVNSEVTILATLPRPTLTALVGEYYEAEIAITGLPRPTFSCEVQYESNVERPLVGEVVARGQDGLSVFEAGYARHQDGLPRHEGFYPRHQDASALFTQFNAAHQDMLGLQAATKHQHQDALHLDAASAQRYQDMLPIKAEARHRHQDGGAVRSWSTGFYQDMLRDRRAWGFTRYQDGLPRRSDTDVLWQIGRELNRYFSTKYQDGIVPPPGTSSAPLPPLPDPCYIPPLGDQVHLLFADAAGDTDLIFICETHTPEPPTGTVVVPVRSVYIVINNTSLRRVDGNVALPTYNLSLTIDADSWTWGFSASLPASMLSNLQPGVDGLPIELEANINGSLYRLLAEDISRERQFASGVIRVSGRGKSAYLAAPYAPILTFANSAQRTAQQLMADVLTFNNIPLGWDIDWQLEDWLVPAGTWNKQGSYMDALTEIAAAAGAYIQPHPTNQELSVLLRYPVKPWDWLTDVTPDFVLPSAVTTRESIQWMTKAAYNRVYVSGTRGGVLGRVTRAGSAGDLLAPMVTDSLITSAIAARQRGVSILGDTGRQAMVGLRLPVLSETGVIPPGKFVLYDDAGTERLGIVRSTSVEVSNNADVWQSIAVETHE